MTGTSSEGDEHAEVDVAAEERRAAPRCRLGPVRENAKPGASSGPVMR